MPDSPEGALAEAGILRAGLREHYRMQGSAEAERASAKARKHRNAAFGLTARSRPIVRIFSWGLSESRARAAGGATYQR